MARTPQVTARIEAVDHASVKIDEIGRAALRAGEKYGRGQAGALKAMREAQAAHAEALKNYNNQIQAANAGLVRTRDLIKSIAAYKIGSFAFAGLKEGDAIQTERNRAAAAGMSAPEVAALDNMADKILPEVLALTKSQILEMGRETRAILLHPDRELEGILPSVAIARQILDQAAEGHGHGQSLQPIVKALESFGLTAKPDAFRETLDSLTKAFQVFGTNALNAETYRAAVMTAGAPAQFWSKDFRDTIWPTLVNEFGVRSGNLLNQFSSEFTGGHFTHGALLNLIKLGLIAKSDVSWTKTGEAKSLLPGHHVKGFETAVENPLEWVEKVLKPALEEHGIESEADVLAAVNAIAPNRSVSAFLVKALEQAELWRKDSENIKKALGFKAANPENASAALKALSTSLTTFGGVLAAPIMKDAAHMFNGMAKGVAEASVAMSAFNKAHPATARVVAGTAIAAGAGLSIGVIQGLFEKLTNTGATTAAAARLTTSAYALDSAAAALSRAAAAQTLGGRPRYDIPMMRKGGANAKPTKGSFLKDSLSFLGDLGAAAFQRTPYMLATGFGLDYMRDAIDRATPADKSTYSNPHASPGEIKGELRKAEKGADELALKASRGEIGMAWAKAAEWQISDIQRYLGEAYQRKILGWLESAGYSPEPGATVKDEVMREVRRGRRLSRGSSNVEVPFGQFGAEVEYVPRGRDLEPHVEPRAERGRGGDPAQVEVTGSADLKATVAVEASPLLLARLAYIETGLVELKGPVGFGKGTTMFGSNAPAPLRVGSSQFNGDRGK